MRPTRRRARARRMRYPSSAMPCFIGCLALAAPRVALVLVWLFSTVLQTAYKSVLWPILGFIFLPLTTLVYAWVIHTNGAITGAWWVAVALAALADLGMFSQGARSRRTKKA